MNPTTANKTLIVKVQLSLFDSEGLSTVLIYDESRKIQQIREVTKADTKRMRGRQKAFFYAEVVEKRTAPRTSVFNLTTEAPWQDW